MNKKENCGAMKIAKFINQNKIRPSNHRPLNIPHIGPRKNANLLNPLFSAIIFFGSEIFLKIKKDSIELKLPFR